MIEMTIPYLLIGLFGACAVFGGLCFREPHAPDKIETCQELMSLSSDERCGEPLPCPWHSGVC